MEENFSSSLNINVAELLGEDVINMPSHYVGYDGLEAIEVHKNFMTYEQMYGFYLGNTLKYLLRHQNKNEVEDLKKARKNLDWLIQIAEEMRE